MKYKSLFLFAMVPLAGCDTPDRSAGGSSYETENAVSARIVRRDGDPASGALVRARRVDWLEGDAFDPSLDLRADAEGRILLELPPGAWRLETRQALEMAVVDVPAEGRKADLGTVRLSVPVTVFGRAEPGARVGVGGLQRSATVDAGGFFHLDSLPAGVHVLRQIGTAARAFLEVAAGQSADAGILRADSVGQIFLDDFEDGDTRSRFGPWTGDGWWWVDATEGINLSPDSAREKPGRTIVADGLGGTVLYFSAAFPSVVDTGAHARCGVDFGPIPLDLSALRSVRFRARGMGAITVFVQSDSVPDAQTPQASIVLDSVWTDIEIPLSSLRTPTWTGTALDSSSRDQHLRHSIGLTWSLSASGNLWLDDIRLIGPSVDLLRRSSTLP